MSADAMLGALLGSKVKESVDFKANLKTVKKEEEKVSGAIYMLIHTIFLEVPNVNNNVNTLLKYAHILPLKLVHVKCYKVQQCARH